MQLNGTGDLVPLRDGVPGHSYTVSNTRVIYDVSCPSTAGCVALGRPSSDVGAMLTMINRFDIPPSITASWPG